METAFAVGDNAVYPIHGITKVVALEQRNIAGQAIPVYILEVLESGSTIVVPTAKAEAVGLRGISSNDKVEEVLALLRTQVVPSDQSWNRRKREYTEKMKTGNILDIAEVMRDLCLLGYTKQLSFSERRMLDAAKNLLVQEIALTRGQPEDTVSDELDSIFAREAA